MSTVSFIESFHFCLVCEGRACVKGLSGKGCFLGHGGTSQCASPLPRVNTARRHRSFLWRSHVEHEAMHGANKYYGVHRGSLPRLNWAACPRQSASRSGNSATHVPSPWWAVRLTRPAHQLLPGTFMIGYTGLNCHQPINPSEVAFMLAPSICKSFQAKAVKVPASSRTSLTLRSTGTSMLRIAAR